MQMCEETRCRVVSDYSTNYGIIINIISGTSVGEKYLFDAVQNKGWSINKI